MTVVTVGVTRGVVVVDGGNDSGGSGDFGGGCLTRIQYTHFLCRLLMGRPIRKWALACFSLSA